MTFHGKDLDPVLCTDLRYQLLKTGFYTLNIKDFPSPVWAEYKMIIDE